MDNLKKIGLVVASSLFILIIFDISIRLYGWAPMPEGYSGKQYSKVENGRIECMNPLVSRSYYNELTNPYPGCVFYSVNNLGFRNTFPVQKNKSPDTKRIVAIGDSFTFGFGVLEDDTFLSKLGNYYLAKNEKVEVINAAEPAADLLTYKKILNDKVSPISPDVLLVGININDVTVFPTNLIIEKISKRFDYKIRHYSKLLDFIFYTIEKNESAKENLKNILASYTPERKEEFRSFINELKKYSEDKKVKVFVMVHPIYFDFDHYAFKNIHDDLDAILKESNLPYYDFLELFKGKTAEDYWITKNDQHPNEKAHQIYFEGLQKFDLFK